MSKTVKAFVEYIHSKERTSAKNGAKYTTYTAKLQDPDTGKVHEEWFQFGYEQPANSKGRTMEVGDFIQVEVDKHGDAYRVVKDSLRIHPNPPERPANPDERQDKPRSGGGGGGGTAKVKQSDLFGEIGGWNSEDDLRRIVYQSALDKAMRTVEVLKALDGLKVSEAQGQAGVAKRYEQTISIIDKLTVKYFNDIVGQRALELNEDEGEINVDRGQPLPDAEPTRDAFDDEEDDFPPEDDSEFE